MLHERERERERDMMFERFGAIIASSKAQCLLYSIMIRYDLDMNFYNINFITINYFCSEN